MPQIMVSLHSGSLCIFQLAAEEIYEEGDSQKFVGAAIVSLTKGQSCDF